MSNGPSETRKWLFVTHKWGDALPGTGESVTIPHLLETFQEWGAGEYRVIWTDEIWSERRNLEDAVIREATQFCPDVIAYTPIPAPHLIPQNMAPDKMRVGSASVVSFYFDLADPAVRRLSEPYAARSDLCVNVDGEQKAIGKRFLSLWPARTKRLPRKKNIDISFLGARRNYGDRVKALALLEQESIDVVVGGGRDEERMSFQEYFDLLDRSWITLNFSLTPIGVSQIKARVFEALSCGCCLVENANPVTRRYLEPGIDFICWDDVCDLPELLKSLLADREKVAGIGQNGRTRFEHDFSSSAFWDAVSDAIQKKNRIGLFSAIRRWRTV